MELYLGTGGYSNDDWLGLLYPEDAKSGDYLGIYAQNFNAVELNSSFYNVLGIKAFQGMVRKSEAKVRFAIKVNQVMTHKRNPTEDDYQRLFESVSPLRDAGMLGPFLAQFPQSFHRTADNRLYLKNLVDHFKEAGETLAVEFRHESWEAPEVFDGLRQFGVSAVSVDYPPLPRLPEPTLRLTSEIAYIRMHGRNTDTWYSGKSAAERHDYLYNPDELREWVQQIAEHEDELREVYLFLNNTTKGHALKNLRMLKELFNEAGYEVDMSY